MTIWIFNFTGKSITQVGGRQYSAYSPQQKDHGAQPDSGPKLQQHPYGQGTHPKAHMGTLHRACSPSSLSLSLPPSNTHTSVKFNIYYLQWEISSNETKQLQFFKRYCSNFVLRPFIVCMNICACVPHHAEKGHKTTFQEPSMFEAGSLVPSATLCT